MGRLGTPFPIDVSGEEARIVKAVNWRQWLVSYCAFSFLMLGVDDAMNHHQVIFENHLAYTPLIFAPLAILYSIVSIFHSGWRGRAWILGALSVIVGAAGTLIHNYYNLVERGAVSPWQALLSPPRPVLAPAAFIATGLLLFLVTWGERRARLDPQATD
jgi:hypothetical protein